MGRDVSADGRAANLAVGCGDVTALAAAVPRTCVRLAPRVSLGRHRERRGSRSSPSSSTTSSATARNVRRVEFFPWPPEDMRDLVLSQDVIVVGGGNTANMLAIWRVHGFDALLREAWEAGHGPDRLECRDDLLVRGRRDRLVRPAARGDARRPRPPARERLPALRRRGAAAARSTGSSWTTASPPGTPPTTASALHFVGTELAEVWTTREGATALPRRAGQRDAASGPSGCV